MYSTDISYGLFQVLVYLSGTQFSWRCPFSDERKLKQRIK
jgi:hypothetical protein